MSPFSLSLSLASFCLSLSPSSLCHPPPSVYLCHLPHSLCHPPPSVYLCHLPHSLCHPPPSISVTFLTLSVIRLLSLSLSSFCHPPPISVTFLILSPASYLSPSSLSLSPASFCLSLSPWFNIALCPRKPEGSLGRTAQDGHLDSHTAPELCEHSFVAVRLIPELGSRSKSSPS